MAQKFGIWLALVAMLLVAGCGTSETKRWVREPLIEEVAEGPRRYEARTETGRLEVTVTQRTLTREGAVDRLYIDFESTYADTTVEQVGFVIASILGGIISVGLYFLVWFLYVDKADEAVSGD